MPIRYAELMGKITGLPPLPIAEMGPPVLTPLRKPLSECKVMILTSSGVHLDTDPPFQHPNDMTFRCIEQSTPTERLTPSHPTPVPRPGQAARDRRPAERAASRPEAGGDREGAGHDRGAAIHMARSRLGGGDHPRLPRRGAHRARHAPPGRVRRQ